MPFDSRIWVVVIHGHGSNGDQLFRRPDVRNGWLPLFCERKWGIITPNLRDNGWMSPDASSDLKELLTFVRQRWDVEKFVFASGSMGGTSNLIYAVLHPEDVAGVVALCPATDLVSYLNWCKEHKDTNSIIADIRDAIFSAYKGTPETMPEVYKKHSALLNVHKLNMPVFIAHGTKDLIIPVSQSRQLVGAIYNNPIFCYREIPLDNHDSPLQCTKEAIDYIASMI